MSESPSEDRRLKAGRVLVHLEKQLFPGITDIKASVNDVLVLADEMDSARAEIARLKHAISGLIPWVASSGRSAAQEALASACELIGVDPLSWSAHPEVLLRRRPDLDRRGE